MTVPIWNLATLQNGYPFESADFAASGPTPLVRIRDLTSPVFETYLPFEVPAHMCVESGDLIIGMDGDFTARIWKRNRAALNQRLCRLRARGDNDIRYVSYALPVELEKAHATQFATTVKHLSSDEILKTRVPQAQAEDQRRIADFLDDRVARIDQIIASRRKQSDTVDEWLTSAYQDVLGRWPTVPFRYLALSIGVGIVVQPAQLYTEEPEGVPALRGLNVGEHGFSIDSLVRITREGHEDNRRSALRYGDVVVVRTGDAGAAAAVSADMAGWNCIDLVLVRPRRGVDPELVAFTLNAAKRTTRSGAAASGSIQQHLGANALAGLPVHFPDLKEQSTVLTQLSEARATSRAIADKVGQSVDLLTEYKQSLITAAVTGELDVTTAGSGVPG